MYKGTIEDVIRKMYQTEKKLDAVNPVAVKKKFDDRKDKDIDNDGDVDSSDKFLHKKRKAISKAVKDEEVEVKEMRPQGKTHFQAFNKRREMGIKSDPKKAKAAMANIFKKKNVQSQKKDSIEVNPKIDDMKEKVQIPDKMKAKMDKIVKSLKKSVGAHAKQAKTIGKMTSMDKPDVSNIEEKHGGDHMSTGRKMSDSEMKKREDIKKGLMKSKSDFKDRYGKDADQVMNALATKKAMESVVNEISKQTLGSYSRKASDASMNRNLPVKKRDNRVAGVKKAASKMSENEDVIRRGDAKVVKVKGPDGKPMFKKMKPVVKVDDPRDHAMKSESKPGQKTTMVTPRGKERVQRIPVKDLQKYLSKGYVEAESVNEAEMNYKVSIDGLPDFFVNAKNPGEVKIKMRKMLKKPDMLTQVQRVPDAAMKKHFRLKAQGKDEDEQQPMKEETVMSEDNTNPLVKAVSDIISRNSFNSFRDAKPIEEKMSSKEKMAKGLYNQKGVMPAPKGMTDKAPGDQDGGAKATLNKNVAGKAKDQDKKIPQGASTLHMCAKNVMHEKYGRGECLYGMHADPDENGYVSHYDIMFNHGIEKDMSIEECNVLHERNHGMKGHKKDKKEK